MFQLLSPSGTELSACCQQASAHLLPAHPLGGRRSRSVPLTMCMCFASFFSRRLSSFSLPLFYLPLAPFSSFCVHNVVFVSLVSGLASKRHLSFRSVALRAHSPAYPTHARTKRVSVTVFVLTFAYAALRRQQTSLPPARRPPLYTRLLTVNTRRLARYTCTLRHLRLGLWAVRG